MPDENVAPSAAKGGAASQYAAIPPAFQGYATLLKWALTNEGKTFQVTLKASSDVHPFRGYRAGASGQRMAVSIHAAGPMGNRPLGAWEAMLHWWSDDPRHGMRLHLRLHEGEGDIQAHPLDGLQRGDELYLACWLIGDEEKPEPPERSRKARRGWNELRPTQQAHVLSRDPLFAEWCLAEQLVPAGTPADGAAVEAIRIRCGISSRREFAEDTDHGLAARKAWKAMMSEFFRWKSNSTEN